MRSLRSRLVLAIMLPMLVILPVVGLLLNYLLDTQVLVAGISNELVRQAVLVADISGMSVEMWHDPEEAQAFVARISPRLKAKLMLLDADGRLIISSDPRDAHLVGVAYEMPDLQRLMEMETPVDVVYNHSQISDVIVPAVTKDGRVIGFVRLTNPLTEVYNRSELLSRVILYVVVGGIVAGVVLAIIFSRDIERPLLHTSRAVYNLAGGQTAAETLKEEGPDEVRMLVRAYNTLSERLRSSEETRQRLLANTVHELGRPLGALLSALQALRSGADEDVALRCELFEGMQGEIDLLQHLLQDLAHLYDSGSGQVTLEKQPVDVLTWLPRVLRTWEESALEKDLQWEVYLPQENLSVNMDPDRITQVLENLVSNAIRYTPAHGKIIIEANRKDEFFEISVQDNGPGVSADEQEKIFKPFYRGRAARRFSEGMGLGLTIARDLMIAHGGELRLESHPSQGSRFTLCIPLNS